MKIFHSILMLLIGTLLFSGCDSSNDTEFGTLRVLLTDAPGNYEAVYIDIREVRIHKSSNADDEDSGWKTINTQPIIVDLLELTNGKYEILGEVDLEPGRYNQLRLILGDQNEVVISGVSHSLTTPSAQQSGLKLNINADIEGGDMYTLLLDFDASRSIVRAGQSGIYILKPVINTARLELSGAIEGTVAPAEALPWVYAIAGADTVRGTRAAENGDFLLIGLISGTYQVAINTAEEEYPNKVIPDVVVNAPETTNVGTVNINE
ncbi:MAG: DUF4382 domain-containing protein [Balneolaceae bacterium]|nr:MAG: DUF4382 domain-containing protein [Balneolaceae bacterium]